MTLPAQDIVERLRSPLAISGEYRDQAADTISRLTADNEALRKDNARLSEENDALAFGMRHGQSLSEDAIHAVRELLKAHDVPVAAFIDDHVGNAIAQRNQERGRADALAQEVERLKSENGRLRNVVSKVCAALPNGAFCSPECSIEFMEQVPGGVAGVIAAIGGSDHG